MSDVDVSRVQVPLNADVFMRRMLRELTGLLQDVVGLENAEGYINTVGAIMGQWIDRQYREEMGNVDLDPRQVAEIFVDLKKRIGGDFYVISIDEDAITVGNRRCPFGEMAEGRDALCMMTSNVFGRIAANHTGYARVALHRTIAKGDRECLIEVRLKPDDDGDSTAREYYRVDDR